MNFGNQGPLLHDHIDKMSVYMFLYHHKNFDYKTHMKQHQIHLKLLVFLSHLQYGLQQEFLQSTTDLETD
jgi:hypothetical protein